MPIPRPAIGLSTNTQIKLGNRSEYEHSGKVRLAGPPAPSLIYLRLTLPQLSLVNFQHNVIVSSIDQDIAGRSIRCPKDHNVCLNMHGIHQSAELQLL